MGEIVKDITATDILMRFKEYANRKGYVLTVAGDYAYRNKKLKKMKYIKYRKEDNRILLYEEGVGRFSIPMQEDKITETTRQLKLLKI